MEIYNIETLLEDKELCKKLIAQGIVLIDQSGTIEELDFKNESMRSNHIKAFEMLYDAGGDELFDAILKEGKTSLADRPDAAKVGVIEINNAKGYYLKSNVSAVVAFLSILNGVKHIENSEECIIVKTFDDASDVQDDNWDDYDFDGDDENDELPQINERRKVSVAKFGDIYRFYDEEKKETLSFECSKESELIAITDMYFAEPIISTNEFDNTGYFGFRYQLEKDGKWGYVSQNFVYFVYPVYDGIVAGCDGHLFGWVKEYDNCVNVCIQSEFSYVDSENYITAEITLKEVPSMFAIYNDANWFDRLKSDYIPTENALLDTVWNPDFDIKLYLPDKNKSDGIFKVKEKPNDNCKNIWYEYKNHQFNATFRDGLVYLNDAYGLIDGKRVPVPAKNFTATGCFECYEGKLAKQYQAVEHIKDNIYILCKEGYYAIAEIDFLHGKRIENYITPYAFTSMDLSQKEYDIVYLERFGKKGAFNLATKIYAVPCEYDSVGFYAPFITSSGKCEFAVKKMDFSGTIGIDGKWIKHLHRNTEE